MAYYRLYFLHPASGRIARFEEFEAPGDAEAIERAERRGGTVPVELWCGAKKIFHLAPLPRSASRALHSAGTARLGLSA